MNRAVYFSIILLLCGGFFANACVFKSGDDSGMGGLSEEQLSVIMANQGATSGSGSGSGSSEPTCNMDITYATPITSSTAQHAKAPSGYNCYFKYVSPANDGKPTITLTTTGQLGNADLYAGVVEDTTGGTLGSDICTPEFPGGGWIRCSRTTASVETLSMNQVGIQPMKQGWFRIIAVYGNPNAGGGSDFTLSITD